MVGAAHMPSTASPSQSWAKEVVKDEAKTMAAAKIGRARRLLRRGKADREAEVWRDWMEKPGLGTKAVTSGIAMRRMEMRRERRKDRRGCIMRCRFVDGSVMLHEGR